MAKRIRDKEDKELRGSLYEGVEEYGISSTTGTTAPQVIIKEKDISSYPSPRTYSDEYLRSKQEAGSLMPVYKEDIIRAYRERQKGSLSDKQTLSALALSGRLCRLRLGAVERSETEGEKRLRFYAVLFLSLRLFACAKSHLPRQREARALGTDSSLQTPICFFTAPFTAIS